MSLWVKPNYVSKSVYNIVMSLKRSLVRIPLFLLICTLIMGVFFLVVNFSYARNISQFKDTISTSAPGTLSNHTFSFVVDTEIPPQGYLELTPSAGFEVINATTFSPVRNIELYVDGTRRDVGATLTATDDQATIVPGASGKIRYQLNSSTGITAGSQIEFKVGNHTRDKESGFTTFSTTTGTTTTPADTPGIINSGDTGTHTMDLRIYDASTNEIANANFLIAILERVGVTPVDTTEEIPPERFNGQPTGELSGTTINVEISLETNEFAICKYSLVASTTYDAMPGIFSSTGLIFHSRIVTVTPSSMNRYYVRCMDDEGNKNTDDYLIQFSVNAAPTGEVNTEGTTNGSGAGSGNSGTGTGSSTGSGASSGSGTSNESGSNGGGSGGGGGGGGGGGSGGGGGGGFESTSEPFRSGDAQVSITGLASPKAKVTVIVDGTIAANATANNNGEYSLLVDKIARGSYTFGIYATDVAGTKSSTFSTSFSVAGARSSALSNINIPPSVLVLPNPVNPGQPLTISGYTLPNAKVTIENEKDKSTASRKSYTATANSSGAWSLPIDTASFTAGTYKAKAKAEQGIIFTNFSLPTLYSVGGTVKAGGSNSDLNRDGKVNLTDFSILLYWWNTDGGDSNPPADISQDKKVNLTDFSILLFNWTG